MSITELSVKRPATIIVFTIVLLSLGILGYMNLGADLFPSIDIPVITVSVPYNGASAEEIKNNVVKPIEDSISGISGIDRIQSTAGEGFGQTIIIFTMETDMNTAFIDVQKAVEGISSKLPRDAEKPALYKLDIGEMPVLTLSISGNRPYEELYNYADRIKEQIESINGVGKVNLKSLGKKKLFIKADRQLLDFYGININTITNRLRLENSNIPAGVVKEDNSRQSIKVVAEFADINDIKNLQIPVSGSGIVRLSEIADVVIEYPEPEQVLKFNGSTTIGINIQKQSDANVVDVVDRVKKELEKIKSNLPSNVVLTTVDDTTVFIKSALKEIQFNVGEGIITTAIVLFLFLRSKRTSLIVLVAIPTSLIATFFMMYLLDFTLNMLSLMALSLCIGILVDDSIVVLENIQRHLAMGKSLINAAIDGRKEIGMAAIAITLCDVVVFAPIAFMSGMVGQYFKQFGLTVVFATLFSLLVSFTLTPMLSSKFLKKEDAHDDSSNDTPKKAKSKFQKFTLWATEKYRTFLLWSLNNRLKVILALVVGITLSVMLIPFGFIKAELMTQSDQSQVMIDINLSPGSTLNLTEAKAKLIEKHLETIPEVKDYYTSIGSGNDKSVANITVKLVPKTRRDKSQTKIAEEIRNWCKNIPGIKYNVNEAQMGGPPNSGNKPVQINISGPEMPVLFEISKRVENMLKEVEGIIDIDNSMKARENEFQIKIDRSIAYALGVSPSEVSSTLWTFLQGAPAGVFRHNGNEYDITVRVKSEQIKTIQDIQSVKIFTQAGKSVAIDQIATVTKSDAQQSISRSDRQNVVKVSANLQGILLGDANTLILEKLSALTIPEEYDINLGGNQEEMLTVFTSLFQALAASVILVYLVLVVLYESFLTPLIRMLALPASVIGALLMLFLTGNSINMMSLIGFIMLDGLASKNGTLLIDYTNTLMKRGLSLKDALIESGTTRLRPIIMTSVTMIVGMLPAALSLGEGSEVKGSMALVIIGGMISSTLITPIVIPVVYTLFDDMKTRRLRKKSLTKEVVSI